MASNIFNPGGLGAGGVKLGTNIAKRTMDPRNALDPLGIFGGGTDYSYLKDLPRREADEMTGKVDKSVDPYASASGNVIDPAKLAAMPGYVAPENRPGAVPGNTGVVGPALGGPPAGGPLAGPMGGGLGGGPPGMGPLGSGAFRDRMRERFGGQAGPGMQGIRERIQAMIAARRAGGPPGAGMAPGGVGPPGGAPGGLLAGMAPGGLAGRLPGGIVPPPGGAGLGLPPGGPPGMGPLGGGMGIPGGIMPTAGMRPPGNTGVVGPGLGGPPGANYKAAALRGMPQG